MPIFRCSECDAVENTAVGAYWYRVHDDPPLPPLCSECGKGKWHGFFPKRKAGDDWVPESEGSPFIVPRERP